MSQTGVTTGCAALVRILESTRNGKAQPLCPRNQGAFERIVRQSERGFRRKVVWQQGEKSRCTVRVAATNSPGLTGAMADQMQKNRRISHWRFFLQCPALSARVQALRKSGHCWRRDFRRSFLLTRPSSEVLPVPLGHSNQTAIKTARPLGHASALLGRAQVIEAKSLKRFSFWQNYWSVPVRVPLQLFFQ